MDTRDALTLTLVNDHNLFIVILMEPIGILVFFNHMMNLCIQFHILLNSHKKKNNHILLNWVH